MKKTAKMANAFDDGDPAIFLGIQLIEDARVGSFLAEAQAVIAGAEAPQEEIIGVLAEVGMSVRRPPIPQRS